jgi:hypothetical protein
MLDWFNQGMLAGVAATLGYLGKAVHDHFRERRTHHANNIRELRQLAALLRESDSVFAGQNYLVRRLIDMLESNHKDTIARAVGFDDKFRAAYSEMNQDELELHAIIRSATTNSVNRLNQALKAWLERNEQLLEDLTASELVQRLEEDLSQLELHLNQWFDKYNAFIPSDSRRALIYLADEKQQGVGYPRRLRKSLAATIAELTGRSESLT